MMSCCEVKPQSSVLTKTKELEPVETQDPFRCVLPHLVGHSGCGDAIPPPPKITKSKLLSLFRYGAEEKQAIEDVKYWENLVIQIADDLNIIKDSIEKASAAQSITQSHIDRCNNKEEMKCLLKLKCQQQQDLMECLKLEDAYFKDLHCAQRAMHESHLKKHHIGLKIFDEKIDQIYGIYESEKAQLYRERSYRECKHKGTLQSYKHESMKIFLKTSLDKKLDAMEMKKDNKISGMKDAMKKMRQYIRCTNHRHRKLKDEALTSFNLKQYSQKQALRNLKTTIEKKQEALKEQALVQKRKEEQLMRRKQQQRQELLAQGENPYVVDELLRVQEKLQAKERQVLECKTKAMKNIDKELQQRERAYRKALVNRHRWDRFWEAKAREKKRQNYYKNVVPFLAHSKNERWLRIAKETYGFEPNRKCKQDPFKLGGSEEDEEFEWEEEETEEKKVKKKKGKGKSKKKKKGKSTSGSSIKSTASTKSKASSKKSKASSKKSKASSKKSKTSSKSKLSKKSSKNSSVAKKKKSKKGLKKGGKGKGKKKKEIMEDGEEEEAREDDKEIAVIMPPHWTSHRDECVGSFPILDLGKLLPPPVEQVPPLTKPVFSWSPKTITFKNYQVGKVYKQKIFVTNKSQQRMKFYFKGISTPEPPPVVPEITEPVISEPAPQLEPQASNTSNITKSSKSGKKKSKSKSKKKKKKEVPKEIAEDLPSLNLAEPPTISAETSPDYRLSDLIKVDFTVPNPITPGLQHSFLVTFTPKVQGNWLGQLDFTSELEKFSIPVEISKRQFIPQMETVSIVFHNTVVQTSVTKRVKIKNVGGLSGWISKIFEPNPPKNLNDMFKGPSQGLQSALVETARGSAVDPSNVTFKTSVDEASSKKTKKSKKGGAKGSKEKKKKKGKSKSNQELSDTSKQESAPNPESASVESSGKKEKKKNVLRRRKSSIGTIEVKAPVKQLSESEIEAQNVLDSILTCLSESIFCYYIEEMTRKIEPGKEITLCVLFRPPYVDNFTTSYEMDCEPELEEVPETESKPPDSEPDKLFLEVTGTTVENPVYIQPMNGDFKICLINQLYQLPVKVHSTKGLGKVIAKVPYELRGIVDIHPRVQVTVNPTRSADFSIKLTPKKFMLTDPEHLKFFNSETNILDFPVYFHLNFPFKLPSPITGTFMAVISDSRLIITPVELNMGECSTTETVKAELSAFNPTLVAQTIGFVDAPDEILIQPNYGYGKIGPNETVQWDVLLSPERTLSEGNHIFHLRIQTLAKEEYNIRVRCSVRHAHATLSAYHILFPITCSGSNASTTVTIHSPEKSQKSLPVFLNFEADLDPSYPIKIIPDSGYLETGKELKLLVTFQADVTDEDVRTNYVEFAQKQYNEKRSGYQRELASITLHLENDWMLEDEDEDIHPLEPRTSLLFSRISNPDVSKALEKIMARENQALQNEQVPADKPESSAPSSKASSKKKKNKKKQKDKSSSKSGGSGSESKASLKKKKKAKDTSSTKSLEGGSESNSGLKKKKKVKDKSSTKSLEGGSESNSGLKKKKKAKDTSSTKSLGSSTESKGKGKSKKKKGKGKSSTKSLESSSGTKLAGDQPKSKGKGARRTRSRKRQSLESVEDDKNLTWKEKIHRDLEKRKKYVMEQLQRPFEPPNITNVPTQSVEFARARRHLLKNLKPFSKIYQIPIYIRDGVTEEVLTLTVTCPVQKPDLVLLDRSSTFDFGNVVLGGKSWQEISLYNVSHEPLKLHMDVLDPYGPFIQCNALRLLTPEHVYALKIRFEPAVAEEFEQQFKIYGGESAVSITLKGTGTDEPPEPVTTNEGSTPSKVNFKPGSSDASSKTSGKSGKSSKKKKKKKPKS